MSKRFFEKSDYIEDLSEGEIKDFIRNEKVTGGVEPSRVKDFYNRLSRISTNEEEKFTDHIDYNYFNCKNQEDMDKVDSVRNAEIDFLNHISKDVLSSSRMLKAAIYLAREFEKMMCGGGEVDPDKMNSNLRRLFEYEEEQKREGNPALFGDIMDMDMTFLNYLTLLSNKKAFLKKEGKLVRSHEGNIRRLTPMDTFDEIFNMDVLEYVMPNFKNKLAQKDVYVRSKFNRVERGQNLIILVDDSGSMNDSRKRAMLKAALTLKLKTISEMTNVYVGTFEMELFGFVKIEKGTTFEELRRFIFLNKGNTDVNGCIMETIKQIKERKLMNRSGDFHALNESSFEVLVINDGQDRVDPTYHPAIKTHALCLMQSNRDLKNICHRSGGTYFFIQGNE